MTKKTGTKNKLKKPMTAEDFDLEAGCGTESEYIQYFPLNNSFMVFSASPSLSCPMSQERKYNNTFASNCKDIEQ